jgi:hypothetical protein
MLKCFNLPIKLLLTNEENRFLPEHFNDIKHVNGQLHAKVLFEYGNV